MEAYPTLVFVSMSRLAKILSFSERSSNVFGDHIIYYASIIKMRPVFWLFRLLPQFGMLAYGALLAAIFYVHFSWNNPNAIPVQGVIAEVRVGKSSNEIGNMYRPIYEFSTPNGLMRMPATGLAGALSQVRSVKSPYTIGDKVSLYIKLNSDGSCDVIDARFLNPTWFRIGVLLTGFLFVLCFLLHLKLKSKKYAK